MWPGPPGSPAVAEGGKEVVPTGDHGGDTTRPAVLRATHAEPAQEEGREGGREGGNSEGGGREGRGKGGREGGEGRKGTVRGLVKPSSLYL